LLHVAGECPSLASWIATILKERDVIELLRADNDYGGGIASDWMRAVIAEFDRRGRRLTPAGR
jgi:hypothetical protein